MKVLNRAKALYTKDYYVISDSIKFEFNQMYLYSKKDLQWIECDEATRSVNLSDMIDNEGAKIFASLSEDGKGGSIVDVDIKGRECVCLLHKSMSVDLKVIKVGEGEHHFRGCSPIDYKYRTKVTGIQE